MGIMENRGTILLAEDDAVSRKFLIKFLENSKFGILTANTGCEAVALYQKEKIDLILMDVRMPEMDGLTAVKMIRQHEKNSGRHVPVIAVTACAIEGDRQKCFAAGMDDYITKPLDLKDLMELIRKWLEKGT